MEEQKKKKILTMKYLGFILGVKFHHIEQDVYTNSISMKMRN